MPTDLEPISTFIVTPSYGNTLDMRMFFPQFGVSADANFTAFANKSGSYWGSKVSSIFGVFRFDAGTNYSWAMGHLLNSMLKTSEDVIRLRVLMNHLGGSHNGWNLLPAPGKEELLLGFGLFGEKYRKLRIEHDDDEELVNLRALPLTGFSRKPFRMIAQI